MISESTLIYVKSGELFARVPLNNQLSEDTDAGKLILTSVKNILIAPIQSKNRQVSDQWLFTITSSSHLAGSEVQ